MSWKEHHKLLNLKSAIKTSIVGNVWKEHIAKAIPKPFKMRNFYEAKMTTVKGWSFHVNTIQILMIHYTRDKIICSYYKRKFIKEKSLGPKFWILGVIWFLFVNFPLWIYKRKIIRAKIWHFVGYLISICKFSIVNL